MIKTVFNQFVSMLTNNKTIHNDNPNKTLLNINTNKNDLKPVTNNKLYPY